MSGATTLGWWLEALRVVLLMTLGVAAITVGFMAIFLAIFAITVGVFIITSGALALAWLVGLATVVVAFVWPGPAALTLLYFIAFWGITTNFAQLAGAVRLRKLIDNERVLVTGGLLSVASGVLVIVYSGTGVVSTIWLIGFYTIIFGAFLLLRDYRLRTMAVVRAV